MSVAQIVEVGPRDGLQSIKTFIPTPMKIALIQALYDSGLRRVEIGSFVSAGAVPQFMDIAAVLAFAHSLPDFDPQVLIPTERRADEALAAGAEHLVFVLSVSEAHNRSNVRRSPTESAAEYHRLSRHLPPGIRMRLNVATAFDCPFVGRISLEECLSLLDALVDALPTAEIALCDTTGRVSPDHVDELFTTCFARYPDMKKWAFHAHDTYGLGLANVLSAWRSGVKVHDASFGGLGGCPFAPGATGNVATEDVAWLFQSMGVETNLDFEKLVIAAGRAVELPGALSGGRVRDATYARRVAQAK